MIFKLQTGGTLLIDENLTRRIRDCPRLSKTF